MRLLFPVPPSVNSIYRNVSRRGRSRGPARVKTAKYRDWIKAADGYFLKQKASIKPVTGEYKLNITLPKKTRGDADNRIKALSDYLVSRAVTPDDKHCIEFRITRAGTLPECEVEILAA